MDGSTPNKPSYRLAGRLPEVLSDRKFRGTHGQIITQAQASDSSKKISDYTAE